MPDTKGHIWYNPIYKKCPEYANSETESRLIVVRGLGKVRPRNGC